MLYFTFSGFWFLAPLTPEAANALISRLSDTKVRSLLLDQLNTQAVEVDEDAGLTDFFYHATAEAVGSITTPVMLIPDMFRGQARVFSTFLERIGGWIGVLQLFSYMFLVFGAAAIVEILFRRLICSWRLLPPSDPDNMQLGEVITLLAQRLTTQVLAVAVFVITARLVGGSILPVKMRPIVGLIRPYLIGFPRLALAFSFFSLRRLILSIGWEI